MAGTGFKLFANGEVLNASDVNTYLQQQTVMVFASAAARTTALSGVLAEGMCSYLQDDNTVYVYNGSAWVSIANSGDITGITATAPLTGGGTSGDITVGIQAATTAQSGAVQLTDSTSSTSTTTAATPNSVKTSYDLANAAIPKSTVTTNGDIIYGTGSSAVTRLGIGSTGQVLTVSGGVPAWATASSGGGTTLIADVQLSASTGYDFTSISNSYKKLILTFSGLQVTALSTNFALRFNSDSGANYLNYTQYQETGSAPTPNVGADTSVDAAFFGNQTTSSTAANTARGTITIYDYASTTRTKVYVANVAHYSNNNGRVNFYTIIGNYNSTTAISSLNIVRLGVGGATISNQSNTSIRLYGVS